LGIADVLPNALILAVAAIGISTMAAIAPFSANRLAAGICAALVGVLLADLLIGQNLIRNAWMSYSVMEGGRYYGIGNEYSGAALGAICALALLMRERFQAKWIAPALALSGILMGLPAFGADAGALAACFLAAAAAFAVSARGRKGVLLFIAGAAAGVIITALIALADAGGAAQSHIGRAASNGGIGGIIYRKAALNTYLLFHSKWTLCLIAAGVGLWLLRKRPDFRERRTLAAHAALFTGAAAMLVLNDSGVVAAANTLLCGLAAKLVLVMAPPISLERAA
jgi:hypothetical protein